ncbi:MAG: alpha/beta hydrolase [Chloroflexi bacterium]|nr:alpha/beta hydrolase [Chloroflexota bacterium]
MMSKPTLLLLPGTLCDATLFAHQTAYLADTALCVVADVARFDTLEATAEDVLRQAPERFALAGLSYGGIVALEIMRRAPQRVTHLALLNTNPRAASEEVKARQQRFVGMAVLGELREITTDFLKDMMLHPDHRRDQALRQRVLAMAENIGLAGFINQVRAQLARPDSTPFLAQIPCPTLVLCGREDQVCPLALHEDMAQRIPNARLVIVEHCGHLSTLEQPEIVTAALRDWLRGVGIWQPTPPLKINAYR